MPTLLIRHKVADYDTWRQVFECDAETRRANGGQRELVFRSRADRNEIWLLLEWDDLARARLFTQSDDLLDAMERAGVLDRPNFWYLEEAHIPAT